MDLDGKIFEVKVFIDIAIYANDTLRYYFLF